VQLSKDDEVVVFHDYHLDDKTNGIGELRQYDLKALKSLDEWSWFSPEIENERIPSLEETLDWAKNKIILSIELKHLQQKQSLLVHKVVNLIKDYQMEEQVQIISFNHPMLVQVRDLDKS